MKGCSAIVKRVIRNSDGQLMACKIVKTSDDETIFNVKKREIFTFY